MIKPTIQFSHIRDFTKNGLGEEGRERDIGFEYSSNTNDWWLTKEEFLQKAKEYL